VSKFDVGSECTLTFQAKKDTLKSSFRILQMATPYGCIVGFTGNY